MQSLEREAHCRKIDVYVVYEHLTVLIECIYSHSYLYLWFVQPSASSLTTVVLLPRSSVCSSMRRHSSAGHAPRFVAYSTSRKARSLNATVSFDISAMNPRSSTWTSSVSLSWPKAERWFMLRSKLFLLMWTLRLRRRSWHSSELLPSLDCVLVEL